MKTRVSSDLYIIFRGTQIKFARYFVVGVIRLPLPLFIFFHIWSVEILGFWQVKKRAFNQRSPKLFRIPPLSIKTNPLSGDQQKEGEKDRCAE